MDLEYKGYTANIKLDVEAEMLYGTVQDIRDVITFQGKTFGELKLAFHESVDDYLEFCAERGEEPEKPFSGRFVTRIEPILHREATVCARRNGQSLNSWVTDAITAAVTSQWPRSQAQPLVVQTGQVQSSYDIGEMTVLIPHLAPEAAAAQHLYQFTAPSRALTTRAGPKPEGARWRVGADEGLEYDA